MTNIIRAIAAGAAIAMLAFMPAKAAARGCGDDRDRTDCAAPSSPVQLDQFMKTWKPVSVSTSGRRTRSARHSHRNYSPSKVASERKSAGETKVVSESKAEVGTKTAAETTLPAELQLSPRQPPTIRPRLTELASPPLTR
jgi:hypothetical protein